MFKKIGNSVSDITPLSKEAVLADPIIIDRMTKLAKDIRSIAPKSDDFLYFSIIFLKAAESALLDDSGEIKKVGHERAWGYFDENWRWHGNVKPHRNSNLDIFPEIELKKAAHDWIGKPLCKDHISDSVDGVRGIILDTHYDEKLKQVVGLCALDRINYADLAKKVETGIIRYGSMGTAVETSVCSECSNRAKTADQYCDHVKKRAAWGEINVGLKPIEYSLVVQPAEPGAILLKCIASLNNYKQEFTNYGVDSFEDMITSLSLAEAQNLESIVKTACGESGCSTVERKNLITSFLKKNNLLSKTSQDIIGSNQKQDRFTSQQTVVSPARNMVSEDDFDVKDYTGASGPINSSVSEENLFDAGGVLPDDDYLARTTHTSKTASSEENHIPMLSKIMEDIMNESSLKRRAELRRKNAYHQGGEGKAVEPSTYKTEKFPFDEDKHMKQTGKMGGDSGSFPGDQQIKEKLSRAKLEERRLQRLAYFQGGSDGVEPETYKTEKFPFDEDKHMSQDGKMGAQTGMFPGDDKIKSKQKRAAYDDQPLSTKLSWASNPNGTINKSASVFEVYAGNKKVLAASGNEIFGNDVSSQWNWFTSKDYGKEVCKQIRANGISHVAMLLKGAQQAPEQPVMPMGAPPAPPVDMAPPPPSGDGMDMPMGDMGGEDMAPEADSDSSPKDMVESSLVQIEEAVAGARDALSKIEGGGKVNINIDADSGATSGDAGAGGMENEIKLSSFVARQLKTAIAEMNEAADELAMVSETYENSHRLSDEHVAELDMVAFASIRDAERLLGQSSAVIKIATNLAGSLRKNASRKFATHYVENGHSDMSDDQDMMLDMSDMADDYSTMNSDMEDDMGDDMEDSAMDHMEEDSAEDDVSELVSKAMDMRRARREMLVSEAAKKDPKELARKEKEKEKAAKEKMKEKMLKEKEKEKAAKEKEKEKEKMEKEKAKNKKSASLNTIVSEAFTEKKSEQDREVYKLKLRRAYDVAIEMQKKGLISMNKTALDKQVDDIMDFDDRAFEAFKRSVSNARSVSMQKNASDLGGVNIGVESDVAPSSAKSNVEVLKMLWDK